MSTQAAIVIASMWICTAVMWASKQVLGPICLVMTAVTLGITVWKLF